MFPRENLAKIHKECLDLGERKSNDYAAVADGIGICGLEGIATRLVDKVLRIKSLTTPGINRKVKDESIRDTLLDVINYATYGVSLLDKTWTVDTKLNKKIDHVDCPQCQGMLHVGTNVNSLQQELL